MNLKASSFGPLWEGLEWSTWGGLWGFCGDFGGEDGEKVGGRKGRNGEKLREFGGELGAFWELSLVHLSFWGGEIGLLWPFWPFFKVRGGKCENI